MYNHLFCINKHHTHILALEQKVAFMNFVRVHVLQDENGLIKRKGRTLRLIG